jgi:hypothetical protein
MEGLLQEEASGGWQVRRFGARRSSDRPTRAPAQRASEPDPRKPRASRPKPPHSRQDRLPRTSRSMNPAAHSFVFVGSWSRHRQKGRHRLALSSLQAPPRAPVTVFHHMHHHLCCSAAFNQTMGKIRIAFFRDSTAGHVQEDVESLPLKTAKAHAQADEDKAQKLEGLPSYPTQHRTVRFDQLPFIAADEVVKRDGTRGSDICMLDCHPLAKHK